MITDLERASIILLSLDKEDAASIMKEMKFQEVEKISAAMYNLKRIDPAEKKKVIADFISKVANPDIILGNKVITFGILSAFLTKDEIDHISHILQDKGHVWDAINLINPEILSLYLSKEKINTVAIILSKMDGGKVSSVLSFMDDSHSTDVINALATLDDPHPVVLKEIESVLRSDLLKGINASRADVVGTPKMLANILSKMNIEKRDIYMSSLKSKYPDLAKKVEDLVFSFSDMVKINPKDIPIVIQKIDQDTLVLALKGVDEKIKDLFLSNISQRMREIIIAEIEQMGKVRKSEVQSAQNQIVSIVKNMLNKGEISEVGDDYIE